MSSNSSGIEGEILIDLTPEKGGVNGVVISSTRPLQTPRIFQGKSVRELLQTLPLLYSVCGTAQASAAVQACESALEMGAGQGAGRVRELLVQMETARENLWRILLDWSGFLGQKPATESIAGILKQQKAVRELLDPGKKAFLPGVELAAIEEDKLQQQIRHLEALLEQSVFRLPCREWLDLDDIEALTGWSCAHETVAGAMLRWLNDKGWTALGDSTLSPLAELDADELDRRLAGDREGSFIATPTWGGGCQETGTLTRQAGHPLVVDLQGRSGNGLLTRLVARLVELAGIPGRMIEILNGAESADRSTSRKTGTGLAQVEAARGRLIHRVELAGETVRRYQILAPTEWNFHPQGVLARGLMTIQADTPEQLQLQARLLVNAIDPCVGYQLRIQHA